MSATALAMFSLTTLRHIGPIYRLIVGAIPISIASHLAHLLASRIRPVSEESYRKKSYAAIKNLCEAQTTIAIRGVYIH
jgi:hypothetical protein